MDSENIEYGAYMRVYDKLSTGLRSVLPSIAEVALSNKLIHVSTLSEANHRHSTLEDRTQRFLMALGDRIRGDRSAFDLFVKLLDGEYGVDYLAKILRTSYNIEKERYAEDLKKRKEAEEHKSHLEGAGPGSYEVTPVFISTFSRTYCYVRGILPPVFPSPAWKAGISASPASHQ